ncbi:MAG TPA: type II secretion system protein, partial [Methylomirabilota bacterium]|nr:type II secretion system protein [Methylomirabilota bacterium]
MAQFSYRARRRSGELVQGVLDVADRGAALSQLERLGLFPVTVEAARASAAIAVERSGRGRTSGAEVLPPALRDLLRRQRKPRLRELATFTQ